MDELLREHNLKVTSQRIDVLKVINKLSTKASIKNIIEEVDMDSSTVYRTINTLESNSIIDKSIINDEVVYMIKEAHKHYFKCIKCNNVTEIDHCPIDLNNELEGFKVLSHSLMIDGICNKCQNKKRI